jgi:hypothetical protein
MYLKDYEYYALRRSKNDAFVSGGYNTIRCLFTCFASATHQIIGKHWKGEMVWKYRENAADYKRTANNTTTL